MQFLRHLISEEVPSKEIPVNQSSNFGTYFRDYNFFLAVYNIAIFQHPHWSSENFKKSFVTPES